MVNRMKGSDPVPGARNQVRYAIEATAKKLTLIRSFAFDRPIYLDVRSKWFYLNEKRYGLENKWQQDIKLTLVVPVTNEFGLGISWKNGRDPKTGFGTAYPRGEDAIVFELVSVK